MLMATVTTPQKSSRKPKKEVNIVSPDSKANNAASPPSPISKSPIKDFSVERVKENVKEAGSTHVEVSREVKNVYKIIQRSTGATGGNGYNGAIYGELTAGSMQKIINYLAEFCHLNEDSCFIDVGAGLGKPNFHVLQYPKVKLSVGVELEEIRWKLSMNNLRYYLRAILKEKVQEKGSYDLHLNHHVSFICADIDSAHSLDPFTHVYMYDLGFPPDLQKSIATKFNNSIAPRYLISYRPPRRVIEEYGYEVELIHQMNTKMFGSGESHMAYFYQRNGRIPDVPVRPHQRRIVLPCSEGINDKKLDYSFSDELFIQAIERLKHEDGLYAYVEDIVERHLNCPRATRSSTCK